MITNYYYYVAYSTLSSIVNLITTGGSDLVPVLKAIISVVDWHSLGLELGLEKYQLDIIDHDNRGKVEDCKKAMISLWLDTDKASWQCLVRALVSPLVGKTDLAVEIAKQHPKRFK